MSRYFCWSPADPASTLIVDIQDPHPYESSAKFFNFNCNTTYFTSPHLMISGKFRKQRVWHLRNGCFKRFVKMIPMIPVGSGFLLLLNTAALFTSLAFQLHRASPSTILRVQRGWVLLVHPFFVTVKFRGLGRSHQPHPIH